jgi:YggT family protein
MYIFVLWARFVLDWILVLNRNFQPKGAVAVMVDVAYTVTDPPIRMFRRVLPPIRLGQISLELGWMMTLLSCMILLAIIPSWR